MFSLIFANILIKLFRDNITADILQGCAVVTLTLLAFIGLVWLREQVCVIIFIIFRLVYIFRYLKILHGGGPEWLEAEFDHHHHHDVIANDDREGNDVAEEEEEEEEEAEDEEEDESSVRKSKLVSIYLHN